MMYFRRIIKWYLLLAAGANNMSFSDSQDVKTEIDDALRDLEDYIDQRIKEHEEDEHNDPHK